MKIHLIGGFLGSGKTTAMVGAVKLLAEQKRKSAVITNDQGILQVDKEYVASQGIAVEDVANGCFCCQHNELLDRIEKLKKHEPEVIFAESVGSCTDLVATVAKPLQIHVPESEVVISVFADAALLATVMEGKAQFLTENVRYIFQKQLEEADIILVNKTDTVNEEALNLIRRMLSHDYPQKKIQFLSALREVDLQHWLTETESMVSPARRTLDLDYDQYADGEAAMAWMDKRILIQSEFTDAGKVAVEIMNTINFSLRKNNHITGHLKFFVEGESWSRKLSFTVTQNDKVDPIDEPLSRRSKLLINARVQTDPHQLKSLIDEAISNATNQPGIQITVLESTAFTPGYPKPTYRMV